MNASTMSTGNRPAAVVARELDLEQRLARYAPLRWDGSLAGAPALHLDDFSGIPNLAGISGVDEYQHRARLRAAEGDLVGATTPEPEGYEEYCRRRLGLGGIEYVVADDVGEAPSPAAALGRGGALSRLVERARAAGGLVVHPFMGSEAVWQLALEIHRRAAVPVHVLAPPPPVTWVANDKARFGRLVELTLGREWLTETFAERRPSRMAERLRQLASRHERVALKRLRCASAMGNLVFDSASIESSPPAETEGQVRSFLADTGWPDGEEVLAVAWEAASLSPSTQLWIPPAGAGDPRLDGVYEQILKGERGVFVGSRPSQLPAAVDRRMAEASLRLAGELQQLGYVGRCSFDLLIVGEPEADPELRFIECNGRWGGTSTPMSLLDRLLPERPPHRVQELLSEKLVGRSVADLSRQAGDDLFDAAARTGRFIFYNVGPLPRHGKLCAIALAAEQGEAERAIEEDLPRLLGL